MPRNWSKAVPDEGNGPIPQDAYVMLGGTTLEELGRIMSEALDKAFNKHFGQKLENPEEMRATDQRSASFEQDARQLCLAMEATVTADKKTRKRTEGAAAADRAKYTGDSSSTNQVDPDQIICSTSFGMKAEPPALPCRDDILVDEGAPAPKPCLSPVEMRTLTTADDLLPAGKVSTAARIIFYQLPLRFCPTEETNFGTTLGW